MDDDEQLTPDDSPEADLEAGFTDGQEPGDE